MGIISWLKTTRLMKRESTFRELGSFHAQFYSFGNDLYRSDVVRACIRPIAEHTSKANAVCSDEKIARILNYSPNRYMNGKGFLAKVRTWYELKNNAIIFIERDDRGKPISYYPVPYSRFEALEYANGLFLRFYFNSGAEPMTAAWDDLVVLRKDYNSSDIVGDDNAAIIEMLQLITTTNQGIANAVKATANLRGILKSTKAMLSNEDVKKSKDEFVRNFLSLENEGGIASLDATQEFTPITMNPTVTNWATIKEFRESVQRYFGISDAIITSDYTEMQMEAFYDARIEPFLVELSLEMTRKSFTSREIGYKNQIVYESNRIQYASTTTKLSMVQLVDRGALTPNEWRAMFNLAPVEGGDVAIRRLDTAEVVDSDKKENEGEESDGE